MSLSIETNDNVTYDNLEELFPKMDKAIRDEKWQLDDLQIL